LLFVFGIRNGQSRRYVWFCLPFLSGMFGAAALIDPAALPGKWGLWLGGWFILLAYGLGWQATRALYNRPFLPQYAILVPTLWILLSVGIFHPLHLMGLSAATRAVLPALFTALAAFEFWRSKNENLPARAALFWIFAVYAAIGTLRIPLAPFLPMPLGATKTETWAVVAYNLGTATLALLASAFIIALLFERVSAKNYQLAISDSLTGAYNRRGYEEQMAAFGEEDETQSPFALLLFDIDHFKSINDRFGHELGDEVIILAARAAEKALRKGDQVFRIGGDEFACFLPHAGVHQALDAGERLRTTFATLAKQVGSISVNATISVGVAATESPEQTPEQIFEWADKALYEAKRSGRNQVIAAARQAAQKE
jgi:diguanylate cyclase (GGDEF)-like protein